ncbi:hypothetical protein ACFT4A_06410 [Streptomyces sp. NPDC057099]|uniref:hypothetical protein n=1 Tax=Streptomyces sp. NPDC057099 TaxID=3346019 RepID=UPI003627CC09
MQVRARRSGSADVQHDLAGESREGGEGGEVLGNGPGEHVVSAEPGDLGVDDRGDPGGSFSSFWETATASPPTQSTAASTRDAPETARTSARAHREALRTAAAD